MKKLSSLFLASAILFSAMPLSARNELLISDMLLVANLLCTIYLYVKNEDLKAENQDLKAKLEETQSNQKKPKESILNKDKDIRPEQAK